MGKNNNIIEINGKRYDATTGAPIGHQPVSHVKTTPPVHAKLDTPAAKPTPIHQAKPQPAAKIPKKVFVHDAIQQATKPAPGHTTQHSKTLMRHTVKKPSAGLKHRVKAHGHTDALLKKPAAVIKPKSSAHTVNDQRLHHAKQIAKSAVVSRFRPQRSASGSAAAIPVVIHKKRTTQAAAPHHHPKPAAAKPRLVEHPKTTADLLEHALRQATSHQQPPHKLAKKRRGLGLSRRKTSLAAVVIAGVILGGFVAFQNLTNVRLHVASSKAGFTASLPNSQPAGYHLSHLNYSPGTVAAHFQSNTDGRSYAITEKASEWDSNTLRDEFLASSGENYQTVEAAGRTLYLYGKNAATWVSDGIWYRVQANGSLSNKQLVALATSM